MPAAKLLGYNLDLSLAKDIDAQFIAKTLLHKDALTQPIGHYQHCGALINGEQATCNKTVFLVAF